MLVIEGADKLGKTTLCRKLQKRIMEISGEDCPYSHYGIRPKKFDFFQGYLKRIQPWMIVDRFHYSEIAYEKAQGIEARFSHEMFERLIAALFAILTPLWIFIDSCAFPAEIWTQLAVGRLLSSVLLLTLALSWRRSTLMRDAYLALTIMYLIPSTFYIYSHMLLSQYHHSGIAGIIQAGYTFLPFVLVAGLSVFPLTALAGDNLCHPSLDGRDDSRCLQLRCG